MPPDADSQPSLRGYLRELRWIFPLSVLASIAVWAIGSLGGSSPASFWEMLGFGFWFAFAVGPLLWLRYTPRSRHIGRTFAALGVALLWLAANIAVLLLIG